MELTLRSRDLVRELGLAQGIVETKTTIPVLSNVLLEAKGDVLEITSTDLELGFRTSCPAEVTSEGSTTVPTKRLHDYARLLPDAVLKMAKAANDSVNLSCGSAKTRIAGMERRNFPELSEMPDPLTTIPVEMLANAVRRTIDSVAGEQSHYTLAGALLEVGHDSVGIVSTDGHRLSLYKEFMAVDGVIEKVSGLMPQKAMAELQKILAHAEGTEEGLLPHEEGVVVNVEADGPEPHLIGRDRMRAAERLGDHSDKRKNARQNEQYRDGPDDDVGDEIAYAALLNHRLPSRKALTNARKRSLGNRNRTVAR